MSKVYVGIDIGKHGALAVIAPNGNIQTIAMPMIKTEVDYHALSLFVSGIKTASAGNMHVVFEKLGVIFGSSKQVAWSMGQQSGAVEMSCICQNVSYTKVNAKDWQKAMYQGIDEITKPAKADSKTGKGSRDTKAMALMAIKRIFPDLTLTYGTRATVPHDGLIDAVLMAEYARRNNL